MEKAIKISFVLTSCFVALSFGAVVFAQSAPLIQTNSATNIQNNSATLNANISNLGSGTVTVWFQWGTTTSYGNQTPQQTQSSTGSFSQIISGLIPNSTYHFEAVAQNNYGTVYGQDMTLYTNQSGSATVTANAGPNLYLSSGQTAVLQGSGYSQNGYSLNYYWTCSGGTLSNYNIAQPTYTAPSTSLQTNYTCTLSVTNNNGGSNSASTTVYLNSNNNNNGSFYAQTNAPTNISNNQATLNGYVYGGGSYNTYVWFQYGTDTNYGSNTNQQSLNYSGAFSQNIANLSYNTTYHYRAVAEVNGSTVYGSDMTFNSNGSNNNNNYSGNGTLTVRKQVIDLNSGNLNWQASVNANPGDVLSFAISIQAGSQDIHNVFLQDALPANLIYKGDVIMVPSQNYSVSPISGINIGTIPANQLEIISYQVQVAPSSNFTYGTTTLSNNATVTSTEASTQTSSASVIVNNSVVYGASATSVSTGLTNNPITDSFFLPLLLIILGSWFYFSGKVYIFADWLAKKIK